MTSPAIAVRELVRYRAKLVALRSGLKAQVHAVLARGNPARPRGRVLSHRPALAERGSSTEAYAIRVESLRDLIELYDREVAMLEREIHVWLRGDAG